jgi:hypothetical protein
VQLPAALAGGDELRFIIGTESAQLDFAHVRTFASRSSDDNA